MYIYVYNVCVCVCVCVCVTGSFCCTVEVDRTLSADYNGKNKNH